MSKTYKECADEIGLDLENVKPPVQEKIWFGYHEGKAIKCDSLAEAKKFKFYETVLDPDSHQKVNDFWKSRNELDVIAKQMFKDALREEYSDMSDDMYNLCYAGARDISESSSDLEEIPDNFLLLANFAKRAIKIANASIETRSSDSHKNEEMDFTDEEMNENSSNMDEEISETKENV